MDRHLGSFALSLCWPTFASERIIASSFECRLFVIFYIVHPETDQLNNYPSTPMTESCMRVVFYLILFFVTLYFHLRKAAALGRLVIVIQLVNYLCSASGGTVHRKGKGSGRGVN
ncbi:hypothetical protein D917_03486 [Trichinella nativa]|uniref:Uncharacterized protein n=1 Tax=Trichinella nativa TaxID=6335 RepID=A0A1Y3E9D1_9BILA|nr:hypothetical protein D917_03486 [Trichinella nativa]